VYKSGHGKLMLSEENYYLSRALICSFTPLQGNLLSALPRDYQKQALLVLKPF
jgi:hypothetical protein